MNITSIHLYSVMDTHSDASREQAVLALTDPLQNDKYIIKSATGLDTDEITSRFYGRGLNTTDDYHNLSLKERTVTFAIRLNPNYAINETPSILRDALYKIIAFTRRGDIELRFINGTTHVASLFGMISKFESSLFTTESEIQITFKCKDPFFRAPNYINVATPAIPSPSWTDALSTAPSGFKMAVTFNADVPSNFVIQGVYGQTYAPFGMDQAFVAGDVFYLSSEPMDRYVYFVRAGVTKYLADRLLTSALWPISFPGPNQITLSTSAFTWNELKYRPSYWGI